VAQPSFHETDRCTQRVSAPVVFLVNFVTVNNHARFGWHPRFLDTSLVLLPPLCFLCEPHMSNPKISSRFTLIGPPDYSNPVDRQGNPIILTDLQNRELDLRRLLEKEVLIKIKNSEFSHPPSALSRFQVDAINGILEIYHTVSLLRRIEKMMQKIDFTLPAERNFEELELLGSSFHAEFYILRERLSKFSTFASRANPTLTVKGHNVVQDFLQFKENLVKEMEILVQERNSHTHTEREFDEPLALAKFHYFCSEFGPVNDPDKKNHIAEYQRWGATARDIRCKWITATLSKTDIWLHGYFAHTALTLLEDGQLRDYSSYSPTKKTSKPFGQRR